MDFHQLLAKMQELDAPAKTVEAAPVVTDECGEMPPAPMGMDKSNEPPPSMSINLNAQGLDNIEELMKLIKAVNPEMDKPEMPMGGMPPVVGIEPMDKPEGGMPPLGGLGNLDSGPLKMLPDLDADNDDMPGGEIDSMNGDDGVTKAQGDLDNDGDHDMDDHDMEKKDKEEAFGNSVGDSEPEVGGMDDAVPNGNDLHKEKKMFKRAQPGDNPMAMEGEELRAWIKSELAQRLAEAKGAK